MYFVSMSYIKFYGLLQNKLRINNKNKIKNK